MLKEMRFIPLMILADRLITYEAVSSVLPYPRNVIKF